MAARALRGDARPPIRRARADVKFAGNGVSTLRNRAFIGGNVREDGKKGRNWMVLRTTRTISTYVLALVLAAGVTGLAGAAKHLDKGWRLHYKPLQGITG
jgi:hypothetical protein